MNLLFVVCHDLGQELGCYGRTDIRSPHLDAFAAEGVRFENNFCTAPGCSPSRASMMTGRFPHANGVYGLTHGGFANRLHDDERHMAQVLGDAGYDTWLFGFQHETLRGPGEGWQRCGYKHFEQVKDRAMPLADDVVTFLESRKTDDPWYANVAIFEPHRPFPVADDVEVKDPADMQVRPYLPDIPEVREDLARMEASITTADRALGRIHDALERTGLIDNTLVVFTVDHGIPFPHAKMTLYDAGIETALMMKGPGIGGGKVYTEMISNVDLMPTLLELLNVEAPERMQGRSFKGLLDGDDYQARDAVFAEKTYHTYYDPMRCIRTDRWKLIANFENAPWQETSPDYTNNAKCYPEVALAAPYPDGYHPPFELYDLGKDPAEMNNLAGHPQYEDIQADLTRRLRAWMQQSQDPLLDGPIPQGAYTQRMEVFKEV